MKNNNINDLLNKYWSAETSIEEESTLKSYFNSENIAPEHKEYAPLFQLFSHQKAITAPHIPLETPKLESKQAKVYSLSKTWRSLAAVFVIALASIFVFNSELMNNQNQKATIVNVEDPEEALEYTKMALAMLSKNYRKGTEELVTGMDNVNKINIIK